MKNKTTHRRTGWNPYSTFYMEDRWQYNEKFRLKSSIADTVYDTKVVLGHDAFLEAIRNPRLAVVDIASIIQNINGLEKSEIEAISNSLDGSLLFTEGEFHRLSRNEAVSVLKKIDNTSLVESSVSEVLNQIDKKVEIDFISDYASKIPARVICRIMGLPIEDADNLKLKSECFIQIIEPIASLKLVKKIAAISEEVTGYFKEKIEEKKSHPDEFLISRLAHSEIAKDEQRLISALITMFLAGEETTASLIGNLMYIWLTENVKKDPDELAFWVSETLRYSPPVDVILRCALEDTDIQGHKISKGEIVCISLSSINRDTCINSSPNKFNIDRKKFSYMSFGLGAHHCIGANLAKIETEIAIRRFVEKYPNTTLVGDPRRRRSVSMNTIDYMKVKLIP